MEITEQRYNELIEENKFLKSMVDTAIKEILGFNEDHGIVLVNNLVFCETYETVFQCLKDRTIQKEENY